MSEHQEVMECLGQILVKLTNLEGRMSKLEDRVSGLDEKIDSRFNELNEKLEIYHDALEHEINDVYQVALSNRKNIENLLNARIA